MSNVRLGYTSVGNLLIQKRIDKTYISDSVSIEKMEFSIPDYQRPYKWGKKNCSQLYEDILDSFMRQNKQYRIGTVILHHDKKTSNDKYEIVDGQQRIITMTLLLSAINEKYLSCLGELEIENNDDSRVNIKENYEFLKRLVQERDVKGLEDYIIYKCEFILIVTSELQEAFQFFDSQNSRGKGLYPHDLLKAYHLREMTHMSESEKYQIIERWEDTDQAALHELFGDYLYRIKRWMSGRYAKDKFSEKDIDMFKGFAQKDNTPYAQYYKGAYSYANDYNKSSVSFVSGVDKLACFQLSSPIISGAPFFEYIDRYHTLLAQITNEEDARFFSLFSHPIINMLNNSAYCKNKYRWVRQMFNSAVLLYTDKFISSIDDVKDNDLLDRFINLSFVWAYSLRAQYSKLMWSSVQNYIIGSAGKTNSLNIYKAIDESASPQELCRYLSFKLEPITEIEDRNDDLAEGVSYLEKLKKLKYIK